MNDSATPRQCGIRRFLSLINLAAVSAVMLAASGCHKDSFDLDEATRPTATPDTETPDGPTTSDPTTNSLELTDTTFEQFDRVARDAGYVIVQTDAMRAGQVPADFGDITSRQYNSPDGNTRVLVEILDYAHLGIQINGNIDDADFVFAHFIENVVTPPTTSSTIAGAAADTMVRAIAFNGINPPILPTATYALEGEMTYNGNRFYPDGELMADFANARIGGEISLDGSEAEDDFGGTTFADGTTPITNSDNLTLGFGDVSDADNSGDILNDDLGFSGALNIITAEGFFSSLSGRPTGTYSGRFNDDADYVGGNAARAAPQEISGIFGGITDADNNGNELKGGFLGQCSADCRLPIRLPVISVMSSTPTAQEGSGQIVLMINSDADAPAGGLAVMITIAGAMDGEFTANAPATCTANLVCTVRILEGNRVGNLVLMPTSDSAMENSEEWTASLVDGGSNYNFAANNSVVFDITDPTTPGPMMPLPEVDIIATSDSVVEGNPVVLVITSDLAAPSTGLPVDINIAGALNGEFTFTATGPVTCTNLLVCTVTIPSGMLMVRLTLTPLSDFSTEHLSTDPGERWTATLEDGDEYNLDAGNNNVGFDITDLIAAVGIMTSNTGIEGGAAVTLTITSSETVPATLTDGLTVTINIGDADDGEFTSANCIGLVCEVVIDPTETTAILIITPSPDTAVEGGSEDWTATIAPDTDNNIFMVDSSADDAVFAVENMLPAVADTTDLADLNAYNSPTALSVEARRAGQVSADVGPITGSQYNDADDNPRVLVERLDYAHLGIGINGNIDDADFVFATLDENVVTPPTTTSGIPTATYALEGEMTYNGNRFYPDGALMADFANAEVSGEISLDGQEAADDFGGTTLADGTTAITNSDNLTLGLNAAGISGDAFSGTGNLAIVAASGFFASLNGVSTGTYSGRFNDAASYVGGDAATAAPQEVSGIFGGITDANGNALNGGFLGQCSVDCRLPIIGVSSSDTTAEEGSGNIVLEITSDLAAPAAGLAVDINIGGSGVTANEFTFTATGPGPVTCTNLLVCTVTIPATMLMVELTLTPIADFDTENTERWTATLEDGDDYNLAAGGDDNVAFDITDLIAAVGIMTSNTGIEGGAAVTLTITSSETVPATLTDGLTVTINIGDADDGEFTSANCIALVCEVVIDPTETTAILIITPSPDTAVEGGSEDWTATIAPDTDNNIFMVDSSADDAVFAVENMLPPVVDGTMLTALNAYATPTALAANVIRNRRSESINGAAITGSRYDDPSDMPQIYVQMLEFAALGIWVDGNAPEIGVDDYDYDYAFLGDNVVNSPAMTDGRGSATYNVEGDATYRGLNFFPDGSMAADFDMRTFRLVLEAGDGGAFINDAFGGIDPSNQGDNFVLVVNGAITDEGFGASNFTFNAQSGFFSGLSGVTATTLTGRFYNDAAGYDPSMAAPTELAGVIETNIGGGADELKLGFLGRRP